MAKSSKSRSASRSKTRSKSSRKSSKSEKSTKTEPIYEKKSIKSEPETVYQPNEDGGARAPVLEMSFTRKLNALAQACITGFVLIAMLYHMMFTDIIWVSHAFLLFLEMFGCGLTFHKHTTGPSCANLILQYVLMFSTFSLFLRSDLESASTFFEVFFSFSTTSALAALAHASSTMLAMEVIGSAEKRSDYSNLVIVESTEKRKRDVFQLMTALMANICDGDGGMNMQLVVKDETGKPMTLSGASVDTGANRTIQLRVRDDSLKLSASNTVAASIKVPGGGAPAQNAPALSSVFNSPYNTCEQQKDMLSPRSVL